MTPALALAAAIAAYLPGWTATEHPQNDRAALLSFHAVSIDVRVDWSAKGRADLATRRPRRADGSVDLYGATPPSITVDPSRDPAALALDVSRRLLLPALEYHMAEAARLAVLDRQDADALALAEQFAEALGGRVERTNRYHGQELRVCGGSAAVCRVLVRPSAEGPQVSWETHGVDGATALAAMAALCPRDESTGLRVELRGVTAPIDGEVEEFVAEDRDVERRASAG